MKKRYMLVSLMAVPLAMLLMSACSAAPQNGAGQAAAKADAALRTQADSPATAGLAKEFEPRVLALLERIARDKRITRETVETELGAKFTADPAAPGQSPQWSLQGPFNAEHGFLIKLRNRMADTQLLIFSPAFNAAGCYLASAPVRAALVKSGYIVNEMQADKRPFTLLRNSEPPSPESVVVRLFDEAQAGVEGERRLCIYRLDISAPGA
ncbi:hypothetical protein [Lysobacter sp. CA199]|uniref:hypothetical protein n=1 Tax=Lysobacter sp. CA199 TaxID=3455608 RepID=UPI003F8D61E5